MPVAAPRHETQQPPHRYATVRLLGSAECVSDLAPVDVDSQALRHKDRECGSALTEPTKPPPNYVDAIFRIVKSVCVLSCNSVGHAVDDALWRSLNVC